MPITKHIENTIPSFVFIFILRDEYIKKQP